MPPVDFLGVLGVELVTTSYCTYNILFTAGRTSRDSEKTAPAVSNLGGAFCMALGKIPTQSDMGDNIRALRQLAGITQQQLADRFFELSGKPVSLSTVGAWERGERSILAVDLFPLAQALNTSLENLYMYKTISGFDYDVRAFVAAVKVIPPEDKHILQYFLTKWSGNRHVVFQLLAMVMTIEPRALGDMIGLAAVFYRQKRKNCNSVAVDLEAVERESDRLLHK